MSATVTQRFPRQLEGRVVPYVWPVDLTAAAALCRGPLSADRLAREAEEMAEHFPRWLLTLCRSGEPVRCARCNCPLVFDRGVRCAACEQTAHAGKLGSGVTPGWFGLLPPIGVDGLSRLREAVATRAPAHHVVGRREDLGTFLLVPLCAAYRESYPHVPPMVSYLPGFFTIRGMPPARPSHEVHLLSDREMCLFASGQWQSTSTVREVLQQRAYAHVIKMLNFANGKRNAFAVVS